MTSAVTPGAKDGPALVFSCEHGGNFIPEPYGELFRLDRSLLDSHRGFDVGALLMAEELAAAFEAPLVSSTVSRLLVDLNRSIGHPRLHGVALCSAGADVRREVLLRHYQPYRAQAEALVRQAIARHGRVTHVSVHSFTPELYGTTRRADVGLLYDPARPGEVALCRCWQSAIKAAMPGLVVRRNYPYAGKGDGLTAWFRRQLPADTYVGVELEINQKQVTADAASWFPLRRAILDALGHALTTTGNQP